MPSRVPSLALVAALMGCGTSPPDAVGVASQAVTAVNGRSLNGTSLNGTSLNGTSLNGTSLNGVSLNGTSLNGTSLNGTSLNGTSLNGTSLNGTSLNGTSLNGTDLVGVIFDALLSNGMHLPLRIDGFTQGTGADRDVSYYAVSFRHDGGWMPLCGLDANGAPELAVPLSGTWNYGSGVPGGGSHTPSDNAFTFACVNAALGKCVHLGYKPWTSLAGEPLADYHQACTRLLRADYCGDGTSFTLDGETVDLYDGLSIQTMTQPKWQFEAEWVPDGALCIESTRLDNASALATGRDVSCLAALTDTACRKKRPFSAGALLANRFPGGATN